MGCLAAFLSIFGFTNNTREEREMDGISVKTELKEEKIKLEVLKEELVDVKGELSSFEFNPFWAMPFSTEQLRFWFFEQIMGQIHSKMTTTYRKDKPVAGSVVFPTYLFQMLFGDDVKIVLKGSELDSILPFHWQRKSFKSDSSLEAIIIQVLVVLT